MTALLVHREGLEDVVLALRLGWESIDIVCANCRSRAVRLAEGCCPDIVVIDISDNGLDLAREMRRRWPRAVIVAVSPHYEESELISAVDAGCDDYMQLPVSPATFVARVRAALRRTIAASEAPRRGLVACGSLELDPARYEARVRGRLLQLTAREFELLLHLAERGGQVARHEALSRLIWGEDSDLYGVWLRKHIQQLRQKLAGSAKCDIEIVNVPRVGYKLVAGARRAGPADARRA